MNALRIAGFAAIIGLSVSAPQSEVCSCALVPRVGESVQVSEESAIIVWDAASKTQHFIRRAQFDTKASDFGFLVPTPTRPTVSEVDDSVFGYLINITRPPAPEIVRQERAKGEPQVASASAAPPAVTVLESVTVAGLDAAVLEANDATALNGWLRDHGYTASPELAEWFKPYLSKKWIITAFKISKGQSRAERAVTSAVRMSFKTDQPFFPYREPATRDSIPRALEVYFVSGERVDGRIGAAGKWPGKTLWAKPLSDGSRKELLDRIKLPTKVAPTTAWLTRFLDLSAPRPGTDELYFLRSTDQSEYLDAYGLEAELRRKESAARGVAYRRPEASVSGDASALYQQALVLENDGHAADAIRIYRRAARAGSGKAAKRLGDVYNFGVPGVSRDYSESLQWYERAHQLGEKFELPGNR